MKTDDQIHAIREILAKGEEGIILIEIKHLFERMRANEKRIMLCFKESTTLSSADIIRSSKSKAVMPGGYVKKGLDGLEDLGLIRSVYQKGKVKPYELTEKGKTFVANIELEQ